MKKKKGSEEEAKKNANADERSVHSRSVGPVCAHVSDIVLRVRVLTDEIRSCLERTKKQCPGSFTHDTRGF